MGCGHEVTHNDYIRRSNYSLNGVKVKDDLMLFDEIVWVNGSSFSMIIQFVFLDFLQFFSRILI